MNSTTPGAGTARAAARALLKETFGYDEFRPLQEEIIGAVLDRRETLAIMPTGGGKSLCYQIPALIFSGLTVVVSPLIALMKDQVDQLRQYGVPVVMLNSSLDPAAYREGMRQISDGEARLLYVAPESLLKADIQRLLASVKVDCLAIDEAHCISEWGHDFRPEYRQLAAVRTRFPGAACLALTATATERVRDDIVASLGFRDARRYVASFNRENLFFQVLPREDAFEQLTAFLRKFPRQSGIVYCFSRSGVDGLAARLAERGIDALPYHAGLADETRRRNQELFVRDEAAVIVATIAFGMGIHKSNIRFVVHYNLPRSVESYYQEIGRAGRDGLPAHCLLLYQYADTQKIRFFIDQKEHEAERLVARAHLQSLVDYAESGACRRVPLMAYFGESYGHDRCGMCDNCVNPPPAADDLTVQCQMFLSCVRRTGERFGVNHVVDVLRGSESKKILDYRHHELTTWGIGRALSKKQWAGLARQFIREGLLVQDAEDFGIAKITSRGFAVLRGTEVFSGTLPDEGRERFVGGEKGRGEHDAELFELLRRKRKDLADEAGVPPYLVFSDKTLVAMAARYPRDRAAMLDIHGVGAAKFDRYGSIFMTLISDYCGERGVGGD